VKVQFSLVSFLALVGIVGSASGIVVMDPDEKACQVAPADGAPWNYVARLDTKSGPTASGVYLGNRCVLTANHVARDVSVVQLNGTNYAIDASFKPVTIQGTDMRVLRIATDPGLPPLPLISLAESEFEKPCVMIGWGVGKGTAIPNQGWNWGDDRTRLKRWATNTIQKRYFFNPENRVSYIETVFESAAGPTTGQLAVGDSGCGLFAKLDGVWKLVGIGSFVDSENNKAFYDKDPAAQTHQPEHSYFAPVHRFVLELKRIMAE
jgi:hypothetical protein